LQIVSLQVIDSEKGFPLIIMKEEYALIGGSSDNNNSARLSFPRADMNQALASVSGRRKVSILVGTLTLVVYKPNTAKKREKQQKQAKQ